MIKISKSGLALTLTASLLQVSLMQGCGKTLAPGKTSQLPAVTAQPNVTPDIANYFNDQAGDPQLPRAALVDLFANGSSTYSLFSMRTTRSTTNTARCPVSTASIRTA